MQSKACREAVMKALSEMTVSSISTPKEIVATMMGTPKDEGVITFF